MREVRYNSQRYRDAYNLEKDISGGEGVPLLFLPRSNTTLGHGRTHCGHGKLCQRISPCRDMHFCPRKVCYQTLKYRYRCILTPAQDTNQGGGHCEYGKCRSGRSQRRTLVSWVVEIFVLALGARSLRPSHLADMASELTLPGQPIPLPRGPVLKLGNGIYERDGQVRASLVGVPKYQGSVSLLLTLFDCMNNLWRGTLRPWQYLE